MILVKICEKLHTFDLGTHVKIKSYFESSGYNSVSCSNNYFKIINNFKI